MVDLFSTILKGVDSCPVVWCQAVAVSLLVDLFSTILKGVDSCPVVWCQAVAVQIDLYQTVSTCAIFFTANFFCCVLEVDPGAGASDRSTATPTV
jgi:hypothetical protein